VMFETARVVGTEENKAVIAKEISKTCEECQLSDSCMSSGDVRCVKTFTVMNKVGARVGERVEIGMSSLEFLLGVFLVYLLPILLLIGGIALGMEFAPILMKRFHGIPGVTAVESIFGFILLVGSFFLLFIFNRWCKRKGVFLPKILKVLS